MIGNLNEILSKIPFFLKNYPTNVAKKPNYYFLLLFSQSPQCKLKVILSNC